MISRLLSALVAATFCLLPVTSQGQIYSNGNPGRYMYSGPVWSPLPKQVYVTEVSSPYLPQPATVVVSATTNPSRSNVGSVNYVTDVYYGGTIVVDAGATLGGSGTISPGSSAGGLIISGGGTLVGDLGSTYSFSLSDSYTISAGNLTISSTSYQLITPESLSGMIQYMGQYYTYEEYMALQQSPPANDGGGEPDGNDGGAADALAMSEYVAPMSVISAVPEPASGAMLLAAGLGAMLLRRRRA